ncbi:MAG: c-type cytochrome biogenesis protein CcsB [Armatimonadetes bacterium]|nr:c-type cytochrome biogenesis protein CcsB [Armatimonadota bacterium]
MTEQLGLSLFKGAFWIYLIATIFYLFGLIKNQVNPAKLGRAFLVIALATHTAALVVITMAIGRPPFLNLYEYMLSFTWAAAVVYTATELLTKNPALGAFCVPLITAVAFFTERLPNARIDSAIMPALQSAWRVPHITSAILAYGAFLIAFMLAIMYLIREGIDANLAKHGGKGTNKSFWVSRLPAAKVLDQTIYRTIAFGFLMQTLLVLVGAVWAQCAWGRYWGWDPKETWSLITWLIYATYLHTRTLMGWRGRKSAWLAVFGFVATGFTLLGVSFLLGGLHSYAAK